MNYLIVICPNTFFTVSVVSQFLNFSCEDHWNVVIHILKNLLENACYMAPITIQKLFCYSMLIR